RFGADAVERAGARVHRRPPRRLRQRSPRCMTVLPGHGVMMAPRLKQALDHARRTADRAGQPAITPPVLLAAVLSIEDGMGNRLLVLMGVDVAAVRAALNT